MVPPGHVVIAPYVFVRDAYGAFDNERHSQSFKNDQVRLHLLPVIVQFGITKSVDAQVVWGGQMKWQDGHFGGGIDDVSATLGFLIQEQTVYVPAFKFLVQQSFPTGKYQNLNHNGLGLNSTGDGSYTTEFGLAISKLLFWTTKHPVNTRVFVGYALSTPVHVENFNSYEGGFGTKGTVHPGNVLQVDLGIEVSITQRWVFATDIVYEADSHTKFHGFSGSLDPTGFIPAPVGVGFGDNLSLAPAIEYNWTPDTGIIFGTQFSVYGRNSLNYVTGIFSWYSVF
jgi:hypothetical protein